MERSFQLGAATRADVLRLRAQAASMDQVVLEATSYSRLVEVRIAIMLREPESTHYEVGAELSATHSGSNEELSRLLAEAQASRLELRALSQRADAERLSASSVTSGNWPRLDGFGEAQYANPNPRYFPPEDKWRSSWALGVALSWTPLDLFGNSAAASGFTANARAVEAQQQALVNAIREEVADQHFAAQRADGALVAAEQGLASAEESYRVAATSFAEGEGTSREVVDAEADLLAARLNELNSRIDRHVAEARLDHALGRDVVRKR
jgi:outer membrane protein TolC